ncbi:DNA-3-methyladenine glycosylase 2 family protein, partial [Nonomuraea terrae]
MEERRWVPDGPLDVGLALQPLRRGSGDPTWRLGADGAVWRTCRTPDGPSTLRVSVGGGAVHG